VLQAGGPRHSGGPAGRLLQPPTLTSRPVLPATAAQVVRRLGTASRMEEPASTVAIRSTASQAST
jgi:hypothetical protein